MAVNMISSGFLLLVLAAGVQSAIKELDATCVTGASADTCVSPLAELVCDAPPSGTGGKCRVKAGQPCKNAGGLCVVGAECIVSGSTATCVCQTAYSPALANGQCTVPNNGYYSACTDANAMATCSATGVLNTANTDCSNDGGCECDTAGGFPVPDYVAVGGTCVALTNAVVGQTCTVVNAATDCGTNGVSHMSCVALKCACDTGYFPTKTSGGTCVANSLSTVGKACTPATAVECIGVNEECLAATSKCTCKAGFTFKAGGVCFPNKGTLTGGCSVDTDCSAVTNGKCVGSPKICKTELTAVGDDCTSTTTTYCATGLTCDSANHKCKITDNYNGGACTVEPATAFDVGSCVGSNTVCGAATGAAGICVCDEGYEGVAPKACAITANMFGASCTATTANTKGTCGDVSLVCSAVSSGFCGCATAAGYSGGSNGGVCYGYTSLGGACTGTGAGACTDPNAGCSNSVCQCKPGYVQSFFTPKCVLGAGGSTDCTGLACVEGSTCKGTPPRCTCDTDKTPTGGLCLPTATLVLGGKCTITETANTEKGTCTDPNAICSKNSGVCLCNNLKGYTASNFGDTCHASDAMMITTSSLLITLAAVISQLFVR